MNNAQTKKNLSQTHSFFLFPLRGKVQTQQLFQKCDENSLIFQGLNDEHLPARAAEGTHRARLGPAQQAHST
jgi:hypothetical protein